MTATSLLKRMVWSCRTGLGEGEISRHIPRTSRHLGQVAIIIATLAGAISCQSNEQGYWTKQNMSQALANEQYPHDSRHCDAMAANDGSGGPEEYKATLYSKCMQAQGYQWVVENSRKPPLSGDQASIKEISDCPTGRLILDSFGYQKCVPVGTRNGSVEIGTVSSIPADALPLPSAVDQPPLSIAPAPDQWKQNHEACRQYSKDSLSNPYSVYTQCMQEKGSSSGS